MSDWDSFNSPFGFIRLILLVDWVPIGILGRDGAMDEYDSYAPEVFELLSSGSSQEELAYHLRRIEVERVGVRGNSAASLQAVAAKLRDAFDDACDGED